MLGKQSLHLLGVECLDTDAAAPGALRRLLHRRHEAVHVVSAVAVVAEQELVVVLTGAAQGARLALDALPRILLYTHVHVGSELEAGGVTYDTRL